jgi:protein-disulfide isomerase
MRHLFTRSIAFGATIFGLALWLGLANNHAQSAGSTATPNRAIPTKTSTAQATAEASEIILFEGLPTGITEEGYPTLGNPDAPAFIEFTDFICPACRRYVLSTHNTLIKQYVAEGKIKLVFRVINNHGKHSQITAEAAYCAKAQGYFWPMHWMLYEEQDAIRKETPSALPNLLITLAQQIKPLDQKAFATCLTQREMEQVVIEDDRQVRRDGVRVQPTFQTGELRLIGFRNEDELFSFIDQGLADSQ